MAAAVVIGSLKMPSHFFFTALLRIAEVVDNQVFECGQALNEPAQFQITLGDQQVLHSKAELVK